MPKPRGRGGRVASTDEDLPSFFPADDLGPPVAPAPKRSNNCDCTRCRRPLAPEKPDRDETLDTVRDTIIEACDPEHEQRDEDKEEYEQEMEDLAEGFVTAVEENKVADLASCFDELWDRLEREYDPDDEREFGNDSTVYQVACELMIVAAQMGHAEAIKKLAENGGRHCVNAADKHKHGTPLMYACHNGHTAAVRALVELDAKMDEVDDSGYTALMICTFCDRAASASVLVEHGAEVDKVDREQGRTALSYAASYGSLDCMHVLGAAGANPFHEDAEGSTVQMLAEKSGRTGCVEAVRKLMMKARMHKKLEKRKGGGDGRVGESSKGQGSMQEHMAEMEARSQQAMAAALELMEEELSSKTSKQQQQQQKKDKSRPSNHQQQQQQQQQQQEQPHSPPSTSKQPPDTKTKGGGRQGLQAKASQPPQQQQQQQQQQQAASKAAPSSGQHQSPSKPNGSPPSQAPPPAAQKTTPASPVHASIRSNTPKGHSNAPTASSASAVSSNGSSSHKPPPPPTAAAAAAAAPTATPHASSPSDVQLLQAALRGDEPPTDMDLLRRQWEAVLNEGSRCRDEKEQPLLLITLQRLLPVCNKAGISVKYGRKLLQRLEVVAPARTSLQSALQQQPQKAAVLEAALRNARPAASLLDPKLLSDAEAALERCKEEEEQNKWRMLAAQLKSYPTTTTTTIATPQQPPLNPISTAQQPAHAISAAPYQTSLNPPPLYSTPALAQAGTAVAAQSPAGAYPYVPAAAGYDLGLAAQGAGSVLQGSTWVNGGAYAPPVAAQEPAPTQSVAEEEIECVVCLEAERAVICVPCMHICLCAACAAGVRKHAKPECPVCREGLEDVFEIAG